MPDRPNILFIITDQQYAGAMSCAGNPDVHTPNMDSLAQTGVRFTRAYCTHPLCGPPARQLYDGRLSPSKRRHEQRHPDQSRIQRPNPRQLSQKRGLRLRPLWQMARPRHHARRKRPRNDMRQPRRRSASPRHRIYETRPRQPLLPHRVIPQSPRHLSGRPQPAASARSCARTHNRRRMPEPAPRTSPFHPIHPTSCKCYARPTAASIPPSNTPKTTGDASASSIIACAKKSDAEIGVLLNGLRDLGLEDDTLYRLHLRSRRRTRRTQLESKNQPLRRSHQHPIHHQPQRRHTTRRRQRHAPRLPRTRPAAHLMRHRRCERSRWPRRPEPAVSRRGQHSRRMARRPRRRNHH